MTAFTSDSFLGSRALFKQEVLLEHHLSDKPAGLVTREDGHWSPGPPKALLVPPALRNSLRDLTTTCF